MKYACALTAIFTLMVSVAPVHGGAIAKPDRSYGVDRFYALHIGDKRVGFERSRRDKDAGGEQVTSDLLIKFAMLGTPMDVRYQSIAEYAADGATPRTFAITLDRGTVETTVRMTFHKTTADWSQTSDGQTTTRTLPWSPGARIVEGNLIESWENILGANRPAGDRFSVTALEPLEDHTETLQFTKTGAAVKGGAETWTAADAEGNRIVFTLQPQSRKILSLSLPDQAASFALSDRTATDGIGSLDGTSRAFALSDVRLDDTDSLTRVVLRATAHVVGETITPALLQIPSRQSFVGTVQDGHASGVFTVNAFHYSGAAAPPFPYLPAITTGQAHWLQPDAMTESDDPDIVKLARQLTDGCKTGWDAAAAIGNWVHASIAYKITGASAKTCLTTRSGDCGPHTNLTIALCRAAGIPARMAGGALYTDLLGGSFGQHYWTLVWMGARDGWIPMDTTTGEVGTLAPTHLTLWHEGALDGLTVHVLDFAPHAAASAAPMEAVTRHANGLGVGYTEKYGFLIDGKDVGSQSAQITEATPDSQTWQYQLALDFPGGGGAAVAIGETGTLQVTPSGSPTELDYAAHVNAAQQSGRLHFANGKTHVSVAIGTSQFARDIDAPGSPFVIMGNILTLESLALRSIDIPAGKPITLPILLGDGMTTESWTLTPTGPDTVSALGDAHACTIYSVAPHGWKMWVDTQDGTLWKFADDSQKLVIVRE